MQDSMIQPTAVGSCSHTNVATPSIPVGTPVKVGARAKDTSQPDIQVRKKGDRIESIVITCCCGEQITILCDYAQEGS